MAERFDVIVIGAGILGCFAARHLSKYALRVAVLEKNADVCTGITRANSGIIYRGYDQHPESLKARMCVKASRHFRALCEELDVAYRQCGLMMLSFGPRADAVIQKKWKRGIQLGIEQLHLIDSRQVYELEPGLKPGVQSALYSADTCVVDPWELGIAAYENARANGAVFYFHENVMAIRRNPPKPQSGGEWFQIETEHGVYEASRVLCCGGLQADVLWEMAAKPYFRIVPQAADYIVFDVMKSPVVRHIISVEPEEYGEGLTMIPTVSGNLLVGPTRRPLTGDAQTNGFDTSEAGLQELMQKAKQLVPNLDPGQVIRSFGAVRPNPFYVEANEKSRSINDFLLLEEQGFFSMAGIKTPGITCANELGDYVAERIAASFAQPVPKNSSFDPTRRGILRAASLSDAERQKLVAENPDYGRIICRCKDITYAEVQEAIARGAATLDGIRRRTGAGMGRCQGGYCTEKIQEILRKR